MMKRARGQVHVLDTGGWSQISCRTAERERLTVARLLIVNKCFYWFSNNGRGICFGGCTGVAKMCFLSWSRCVNARDCTICLSFCNLSYSQCCKSGADTKSIDIDAISPSRVVLKIMKLCKPLCCCEIYNTSSLKRTRCSLNRTHLRTVRVTLNLSSVHSPAYEHQSLTCVIDLKTQEA